MLGEALPEYCSSITTTPSCCCWSHLPQSLLPPCWIKKEETWLFRTCVERGGAVRSVLGSPVIRITSCSTTSSPFFERFRSRSTRYVDASIHSLLDELLDDLGETSRKFFIFCNVPQHSGHQHEEVGVVKHRIWETSRHPKRGVAILLYRGTKGYNIML